MAKGIALGFAVLLVTATVSGLCAAPSRAGGSDVRISAPAALVAGKPCRVTVAVSAGVAAWRCFNSGQAVAGGPFRPRG